MSGKENGVGFALTGLGIAAVGFPVAYLANQTKRPEHTVGEQISFLQELRTLSPNEIGDTLAGIAGSLAFIGILVTIWIQSRELRAQREELAATREQLELSRIAQEAQVDALEKQARIFEDEKKQRDELKEALLLEQRLDSLRISFLSDDPFYVNSSGKNYIWDVHDDIKGIDVDEFFPKIYKRLLKSKDRIEQQVSSGQVLKQRASLSSVVSINDQLNAILGMVERLGADQVQRLEKIAIPGVLSKMNELAEMPIWDNFNEDPEK